MKLDLIVLRLVDEFNAIDKYVIASFFWWTVAAICSTMLILQIQLVEYSYSIHIYIFPKKMLANWINSFYLYIDPKSEHTASPILLVTEGVLVFWSFVVMLLFCFLGEMVTHQFNMFNETLNNTNWYLFPNELQRMLVIFMSITQQSTLIRGYGNNECTRDAFKQVLMLSKFCIFWRHNYCQFFKIPYIFYIFPNSYSDG